MISYQHGIPEQYRQQAAALYDSAFGAKFAVAVPDQKKRIALLAASLCPEFSFAAIEQETLIGLAGYKTVTGALTGGMDYSCLLQHLGLLRGNWAAFIFGLYERPLRDTELLMDGIAVHPQWRGQGIGAQLLTELANFASANNFKTIRLDVIDSNPGARRLYEKNGFVEEKTEQFEYLRWLLGFGAATTMIREIDSSAC